MPSSFSIKSSLLMCVFVCVSLPYIQTGCLLHTRGAQTRKTAKAAVAPPSSSASSALWLLGGYMVNVRNAANAGFGADMISSINAQRSKRLGIASYSKRNSATRRICPTQGTRPRAKSRINVVEYFPTIFCCRSIIFVAAKSSLGSR